MRLSTLRVFFALAKAEKIGVCVRVRLLGVKKRLLSALGVLRQLLLLLNNLNALIELVGVVLLELR